MAVYFQDPRSLTLQQEAIRRVKEMQQKAQASVEQQLSDDPPVQRIKETVNNAPPVRGNNNDTQRSGTSAPPHQNDILSQLFGNNTAQQRAGRGKGQPPPKGIAELLKRQGLGESLGGMGQSLHNTVSSVSQPIADILDSFGIDGEKLIILMVMWAVFNESKENKTLLLALGYLLI